MSSAETLRKWPAIEVHAVPEAAEAVEFALNGLDPLGTEINYLRDKGRENIIIAGYFDEPPDLAAAERHIRDAVAAYGHGPDSVIDIDLIEIEDRDWLEEWKKHWTPTNVGRFIVAPPWADVDDEDAVIIRLEPGMAFGTGTHATTMLCLAAIDAEYCEGETFFDVGTGTGVLAIAAAKAYPTASPDIAGCDTDELAVEIARENLRMNGVEGVVRLSTGPLTDQQPPSDIVCANLTLDVILPILPLLLSKSGRRLILSGILAEQEGEITSALANLGVTQPRIERAGEWIAVIVPRG